MYEYGNGSIIDADVIVKMLSFYKIISNESSTQHCFEHILNEATKKLISTSVIQKS